MIVNYTHMGGSGWTVVQFSNPVEASQCLWWMEPNECVWIIPGTVNE